MLEKYYRIGVTAGLSIELLPNGTIDIDACEINLSNNQLNITRKIPGLPSVEELKKHLTPKTAIALNLSGKGVLHRQIEKVENINQNNFGKILTNANIDDFYVQNFISGDQSFVSVIRKTEADKWINQVKTTGFQPLMLSLGAFTVEQVIPQLNIYDNDMVFNGHVIKRNEKKEWISYQYHESNSSPFTIKAESEIIDERLLIAYASAFQLAMADQIEAIRSRVPELESELKKQADERKLKVQGVVILAVFFLLLLINFFVFYWLNSSNTKLADQVSRSAQTTTDVQQLNEQVKQKEALLKLMGWEDNVSKSNLIDQLAALLPEELTWQEAAIDPVDAVESRLQKTLIFSTRRIRVTGFSEKIIPVNEWIARIKTKPWVKNIQLNSYTYNNEINTGQYIILIDY